MTAREQGAPQLIGSDYGAIADLYDYVTPYRRRPDVGFYVEAAQEWGGPVLEVGCGTGRVLIPTARTGLAVTGIDLSPAMLRVCRERLQQEPAAVRDRVQLIRADMRSFALGRTFPLATIPFRPLQHLLAVADQMACLRTIWRHLEEGGRLVLDVFNPSLEALVADNVGEQVGEAVSFTL
ncbi:MAG: methyltransferase domain-containing protein, partial [Candidatus Promineifilaceae bacterium]|nr:methyltransferase domain-containing protein [Candidatus Promineifilaceae bacterium]